VRLREPLSQSLHLGRNKYELLVRTIGCISDFLDSKSSPIERLANLRLAPQAKGRVRRQVGTVNIKGKRPAKGHKWWADIEEVHQVSTPPTSDTL
jgi:hypothetical protein